MGTRSDLAAEFAAQLAADGLYVVNVYDHPADVVSLPAVVIDAADPYVVKATMGGGAPGANYWMFNCHIVAIRTVVGSAFELTEQVRWALVKALANLGATWESLSAPTTIQVNDQPALQSNLDVAWLSDQQT